MRYKDLVHHFKEGSDICELCERRRNEILDDDDIKTFIHNWCKKSSYGVIVWDDIPEPEDIINLIQHIKCQ